MEVTKEVIAVPTNTFTRMLRTVSSVSYGQFSFSIKTLNQPSPTMNVMIVRKAEMKKT